ncbi:hypothetical protein DRO61_05510 [Candidatus Bathyarchaeota archaeon]|nr:MAG: hypothetical protein DRO61_05510 [Candidatus Bathyarchaeota archaeon]
MGSFSYMCNVCGEAIAGPSHINKPQPDRVHIFYILKGVIVESQKGFYDGYGKTSEDKKGDNTSEWITAKWDKMLDVHFNDDDSSGFMAVHEECIKSAIECKISKDDPNQGCGDEEITLLEMMCEETSWLDYSLANYVPRNWR